ncbi:ABC transporter permease [bacterium]|nr:ABC transporter permease [bacterium]
MLTYLLRRLAFGLLTVLGVLLLLFVLFFLVATPDDVARKALGDKAMPEAIEQWKANHGYLRPRAWNPAAPFDTILADHLRRMLTFDFGRSDADDAPISDRLRRGVGPSLALTVPLFTIGLLLAIALALLVAYLRDSLLDRATLVAMVVLMSVSLLLYIVGGQYLLGKVLRWFPISGFDPAPAVIARFLAMPVLIGVLASLGPELRYYRAVFLEERGRDYVRTAYAKGCAPGQVMRRHVLRNALIPIITNVVIEIPFLFTGSILLESFFGIPGLGTMTVEAINGNDFATLRVMVYIGALLFIAGQLATDVAYALADPRVRLE